MTVTPESVQPAGHETRNSDACRPRKIVTFYEDFADAIRAHRMLDCIARSACGDLPVHLTSWSFTLLRKSELNAILLADTAFADVIVVAMKGCQELPERVATWVEVSLNARLDAEPVLVALHDDGLEADGTAAPLCSSLKRIADRRQAKWMSNADLPEQVAYRPPKVSIRDPRERSNPTLEIPLCWTNTPRRWWGINE